MPADAEIGAQFSALDAAFDDPGGGRSAGR
jgi:hypothetical protein